MFTYKVRLVLSTTGPELDEDENTYFPATTVAKVNSLDDARKLMAMLDKYLVRNDDKNCILMHRYGSYWDSYGVDWNSRCIVVYSNETGEQESIIPFDGEYRVLPVAAKS